MRRLRVRPSQPGLRGPRESPPGPTTWVRPATGWWERMNAGRKILRNQGLSVKGAPVRFQKAVSRTKEKRRGGAPIGAPARVMGRPFPSAEGTGFAVRLSHRVRRSAPALVGASPPSDGGTFPNGDRAPTTPNDEARPRDSANQLEEHAMMFGRHLAPHSAVMPATSPAITNIGSGQMARLLRFARNDGRYVVVKR
jgi:hypothetical protein